MNQSWKKWGIGAGAAALALSVAFGTVATTWAQDQTGPTMSQRGPQGDSGSGSPMRGGENGGPGGERGPGRADRGGISMAVIAEALGLSEADLQSALAAGETVADLATANDVDLQTVIDALVAAQEAKLTQAVTDGRLTQAEADERLATYTEQLPTRLNSALPSGRSSEGPGQRGGFGLHGSLATIATALGISESDLQTARQSGQSVADLATANGVALQSVIDAIVAEQSTALAQAVTDGRLTQAQADEQLAKLAENLPTWLSKAGGFGPRGGGRPGHGAGQDSQSPLPTPAPQSSDAPVVPATDSSV
ncbi:MAG: hypothetical protein KF832_31570 [Caldilineaceae bacterium]|nr:hypothetical protein [Caldilineaceae bacterium]